ncbi:MAG: hypothetical protein J0I26_00010 [Alphaproteobacteria bacterium]|nr:hypothetical protein [Alphaproteobacteria bacterium]MBN9555897.1 hypothetical protein [Alphaproteobacteria bacterium]MBN9577212.1 hypothetical protein [Alphaproteobacteria bacterium]MBN9591268.1 hypothetical protein [Alphaproteobacteria bacterium]
MSAIIATNANPERAISSKILDNGIELGVRVIKYAAGKSVPSPSKSIMAPVILPRLPCIWFKDKQIAAVTKK